MDNRRQVEALRAANRGMARAVCQGAKTAKRYAALGAGMEVDAQGYGREPTAMVRGVLSCLFVCLFLRARARVRQTWGFFMDVYSGEAYGRRVRALQGETSLQVFR